MLELEAETMGADWDWRAHYAAVRDRARPASGPLRRRPSSRIIYGRAIGPTRAVAVSLYDSPIGPELAAPATLYEMPIGPVVPRRDWLSVATMVDGPSLPVREDVRRVVLDVLARNPDVAWIQVLSPRRKVCVALVRQIIYWRLYEETQLSFPEIARLMGRKEHTVVMHGVRKVARLVASGALTYEQTGGRSGCNEQ
jgi:hypothetical protein